MYQFSLGLIILVTLLGSGCSKSDSKKHELTFERNILLSDYWILNEIVKDQGMLCRWCDSVEIDYDDEKVYLVDVVSSGKIKSFLLNGSLISCTELGDDRYQYDLTKFLSQSGYNKMELDYISSSENEVSVTNQPRQPFKAQLHRLNKFFIAACNWKPADSGQSDFYDLEVLIKNLNSYELQGQLRYAIYDLHDNLLFRGQAPVFVDGNSETQFLKNVKIETRDLIGADLLVITSLYWEGNLVDKIKYPL